MPRSENKNHIYKIMSVKTKSGYGSRIVLPNTIMNELYLKPGDSVQYIKSKDGYLIKKA